MIRIIQNNTIQARVGLNFQKCLHKIISNRKYNQVGVPKFVYTHATLNTRKSGFTGLGELLNYMCPKLCKFDSLKCVEFENFKV